MRQPPRLVLTAALLLGPAVGIAGAVTTRDLVELKKAGLSDDVLVALLQSDGSVFRLTAADVIGLRDQGLSETVIIAMLKTATPVTPVSRAQPPAPTSHEPDVDQTPVGRVQEPRAYVQTIEVLVPVPVFVRAPEPSPPKPPAYWGWGGRPRPGSWGPPDTEKTTTDRVRDRNSDKNKRGGS